MVVLCACRDHILRGILSFLTIPFYDILSNTHGEPLQWKQRGLGMESETFLEIKQFSFLRVKFRHNILLNVRGTNPQNFDGAAIQ